MRSGLLLALISITIACGDNGKQATTPPDGPPGDAAPDAPPDAPPDAAPTPSELIAAARAAADGTVSLPIRDATVTYLKPQIGDMTNDPAGFTIQADQMGPALFVAVDPATTTPPLVRGDVVSFTITMLATEDMQKRAIAIENLTRSAQGANVGALAQDVSTATDLVSALDSYDSEIIDVTGTLGASFGSAGSGFESIPIDTAGITGDTNLRLRVPSTLRDAIDMVGTCQVTLNDTPVGRFDNQTQLAAFTASDVTLTGCPAPTVVSATDASATSVQITFSRRIDPNSVMADGSQFTFDNNLTASAATVDGRTVTVTTDAQAVGTTYTVTVANTVTDLQGTAVGTPNTATFLGFEAPATVRLNEVNVNITSGCDLVELRVVAGGTLRGVRFQERNGGNDVVLDLPDLDVATNDIVVLHFNADSATCNPSGSTDETTAIDQNTGANDFATAWDLYAQGNGLVATDNVLVVFDRVGAVSDAVLIDGDDNTSSGASESAAAAVAGANQWQMVGGGVPAGGFVDADFTAHAVIDSNGTGTDNTGETLRRVDDTDDNDKADWDQGTQSWGTLNPNQAPI